MRKLFLKLNLIIIVLISLVSCKRKDTYDIKLMDNYIIEKGEKLVDQKVYRLSTVINPNTISNVTASYDWEYSNVTVFFKSDCLMSRDELGAFMNFEGNSFEFDNVKHSCDGTYYFSYGAKNIIAEQQQAADTKYCDENDKYAFYYMCDLQQYKITSKKDNISFELFVTASNFYIGFVAA